MAVINLVTSGCSTFSTTGSIGAGSNSLVVASSTGLAVNNYVIVEIGGESGAGLRGTTGVGGVWPDLSYATVAAMNADTGKTNGQYAYVVATGDVYRSNGGVWSQQIGGDTYYTQKVIPRSLVAKITAKVGTTLTLDTAAVVAATNANVYFDNTRILAALGDSASGVADGSELFFPAGAFALSSGWFINQHHNWYVHGAGIASTTVFFPKGVADRFIIFPNQSTGVKVSQLAISGNTRANGYMVAWLAGSQLEAYFNFGIYVVNCTNPTVEDVKATDCNQSVSFSYCNNPVAQRITSVLTEGVFRESWQVQGADSTGGTLTDCTVTSPTWIGGFEWFRSSNCAMLRCTGTNTILALNTCNNWTLDNISLTINGAQKGANTWIVVNNPIIDINANIGGLATPDGGQIRTLDITQNGVVPPNSDTLIGIVIGVPNIKVRIDGATIALPNYVSGSALPGAVGLLSNADQTTVNNFTCHGTTNPPTGAARYANLTLGGASSTYRSINVDSVKGGTEVFFRSITLRCVA